MRLRLVVLDANYYWTEQLFSSCQSFADVLLLRPVDYRTFCKRYGSYFIDLQPQQIDKNVWEQRICCTPGWLFHYWPLTKYFFASLIHQFRQNHPLLFVFSYPYYHTLAKILKVPSIYYSIDDYTDYWLGREVKTTLLEYDAVTQAQLTLCVAAYRAKYLQEMCPNHRNRVIHIPHGCSPKFMVDRPLIQPKNLPKALQNLSRPIAGYIGTLGYRFDFQYLVQVAKQLPDINFVLGGPLPQQSEGSVEWWSGVEQVQQLPNITFLGEVTHQKLGEYLQAFDVLLMCYSNCKFNHNACPTKLWDYMGTSRPIVTNSVVPEVNLWKHALHIADKPDEFAYKLRLALVQPSLHAVERLSIAKANTWNHQAQKLYSFLQQQSWFQNLS